jgi:hypothetical protein
MAGIVISGHDGTTVSQNKISITPNQHGDAAAGIVVSDQLNGGTGSVSQNLVITDNDARGSAFGVIVTTGNAQGDVVRDNKGNNLISGTTGNATRRSMNSCDDPSCQ